MNQIMMIIGIIALCLFALAGLIRPLQMLQLNSYYNARFWKWLTGNWKRIWSARFLLCLAGVAAELWLYYSQLWYGIPFAVLG